MVGCNMPDRQAWVRFLPALYGNVSYNDERAVDEALPTTDEGNYQPRSTGDTLPDFLRDP